MSKRGNYNETNKSNKNFKGDSKTKTSSRRTTKGTSTKDVCNTNNNGTVSVSTTNDPAWYSAYPELARDSGKFSFTWPTGMPLRLGGRYDSRSTVKGKNTTIPGILSINLMHTVGYSDNATSAINVAARNLYAYVRHANSGHSNYDPADLMIYILGMNDVYSVWAWMRRLYGALRLYSPTNRYYPKALVDSMGVDFDSIIEDIADLRYFINNYAIKISSMCIPASMPYTARRLWLYSNLYSDSSNAKGQVYKFEPEFMYRFGLDEEGAGRLTLTKGPGAVHGGKGVATLATIKAFAEGLFDAYYASEDAGIMSGDILKAFGDAGIVKLVETPEDYMVFPMYDEYVLAQIENSNSLLSYPNGDEQATFGVSQNTDVGKGWIESKPSMVSGYYYAAKRMINFHVSDVNEALVFEGTRLTIGTRGELDGDVYALTCGTEVVARYMITYYAKSENDWKAQHEYFHSVHFCEVQTPLTVLTTIDLMRNLSCFNNHPIYNVMLTNNQGEGGDNNFSEISDPVGNLDVWTAMDYHDLQKLNDTATLSLFYTPLIARAKAY